MNAQLFAYVSLTAALVITPGATTAVVVRNTLSTGWRGGIAAALGAAVGNSTHAAAAGLGLAVVVSRVPMLLLIIQLAGGAYLAWLGVTSLRRLFTQHALPASDSILNARGGGMHHAVREGVTVNLLNPAIALFYLAVVPSFLPQPAPRGYYVQLAAIHVAMAFCCHGAWAFGLDRLRHALTRPAARMALEAVTAGALLLLALRVLNAALSS